MIYIKRDISKIPKKVLDVAKRAERELENLPLAERNTYIKKKSHIWRSFNRYLSKMSYGKCWYSEAKDAGANFDVDHFRPKSEAKRTDSYTDVDGYAWLAFDWENYRLSSQNCNRLTKDESSGETVGKGSWFPLMKGSKVATWDDRCVDQEIVVLLDPVDKEDLVYIDFDERGLFVPSQYCVGTPAYRVEQTAKIYGLNLERMREARHRAMKDVKDLLDSIATCAQHLDVMGEKAPMEPIDMQINKIKEKTRADAPFSRAVRTQLRKLGADDFFIDTSLDMTP